MTPFHLTKKNLTKLLSIVAFAIDQLSLLFCNLLFWKKIRVLRAIGAHNRGVSELVVLANGPSLSATISENLDYLISAKCVLATNFFASSQVFYQIQPSYYVLSDPKFWVRDPEDDLTPRIEKLMNNLEKCFWPLTVITTAEGYASIQRYFEKKGNIHVISLPKIRGIFFTDKGYQYALSKLSVTPRSFNVLTSALGFALAADFTAVKVYGADFSSFKHFEVDQKTNQVRTTTPHFYNPNRSTEAGWQPTLSKPLHIRLRQAANALEEISHLNQAFNRKGVVITNHSKNSYIDSINRAD